MMNTVLDKIEAINYHTFQKLQKNGYEQGSKLEDTTKTNKENKYVFVPKACCKQEQKPISIDIMKTVFEKIVYICENGEEADVKYKERFYRSFSDEIYKSVSKRFNILKKNMLEFIYEKDYVLPKQKEIIFLLCSVLKTNIIITIGKEYYKYHEQFEKTILVNEKESSVYSSCEHCEMDLACKGYYENVDFNKMRLLDIKMYIEKYKIQIPETLKKKEEIIRRIKDIRAENKN